MNGMLDKITSSSSSSTSNNNNNESSSIIIVIITQVMKERLQAVDDVMLQIVTNKAATKKHESNDKATAKEALEAVLLPAGVTLDDVVRYQDYHRQLKERRELQAQLETIQSEVAGLEQMRTVAKELGQSANACSMMVVQ
jgi:hypothetical protein